MADKSLTHFLDDLTPDAILECTDTPWSSLAEYCGEHQLDHQVIPPSDLVPTGHPAQLAIVHDALEHLDRKSGEQLLGYLRNNLARQIWVLLPADYNWPMASFLGLGFRRDPHAPLAANGRLSYTYDLSTYNHKRQWNNPRFWANPENFHKYRW